MLADVIGSGITPNQPCRPSTKLLVVNPGNVSVWSHIGRLPNCLEASCDATRAQYDLRRAEFQESFYHSLPTELDRYRERPLRYRT